MKINIDDSLRLFRFLVVLLILNCIWVSMTTIIHGVVSLEGFFSSLRLLLSTLFCYAIHRHVTLQSIGKFIFLVAAVNSAFVVVQMFDAISSQEVLPVWMRYGEIYGIEDVEVWRKGGLVPSLQTSSLLAVYGMFFGAWRKSRKIMLVVFPLFAIAILVGARTFVPVGLVGLVYLLIRMPLVISLWLGFLAWYLTKFDGFWEFFQLRFGGLFDVFLRFDPSSDYSAADTLQSYREFSSIEFFVGNGENRYSDIGGKDPFYTRWLYQSGAMSVFLLLTVLAVISRYCGKYTVLAYMMLAVAGYHNIKGELFTSFGVFDLIVLVSFIFLRGRGVKDMSSSQYGQKVKLAIFKGSF